MATKFQPFAGGHTSEMLTIISSMDKTIYTPRIYVISESDTLSQQKLRDSAEKDRTDYFMETIQRPREVGQNWISSLLYTTPQTFYQCRGLIKEYRPNLVSAKKTWYYFGFSAIIK